MEGRVGFPDDSMQTVSNSGQAKANQSIFEAPSIFVWYLEFEKKQTPSLSKYFQWNVQGSQFI